MYINLIFVLLIIVDMYDLCFDSDHKCGPNDIHECISDSWVCDYNIDCQDGSDEINCPPFKCDKDQVKCLNINKCISKDMICNGNIDCADNSDELNCKPPEKSCSDVDEYDCMNSKLLECIPLKDVCNGKFNCSTKRNAKENCNINMCAKGFCSHRCINKYSSFICDCPKNMILDRDKKTCKHFYTCLENPEKCSQGCTDIMNGYKCYCYKGYTYNGSQCILQSPMDKIYLLYSSYKYIYGVPLFENSNFNFETKRNISTPYNIISFDIQVDRNEMILYASPVETDHVLSIDSLNSWLYDLNSLSSMNYKEKSFGYLSIFYTAFDPARNLLFFTDIKNHSISVMNVTSNDIRIIIDKDIVRPINIVIDPVFLKIFWIDLDGPRICMSNMDGSSKLTLIEKGLHRPSSLAIDIEDQKLYWVDNLPPSIQYIDIKSLNTANIKIESLTGLENLLAQPFSLFVFENRIYWSDWILNGIFSANKISGKNVKLISKGQQQKSIRIFSKQYNIELINKIRKQNFSISCSGLINNCPYSCLPSSNSSQFPICFGFRPEKKISHMYIWLILIPVVLLILCLTIYKLKPSKTIIVRQTFTGTVHIRDSVKFWEEDQNSINDDIQAKDTTPIIFKS